MAVETQLGVDLTAAHDPAGSVLHRRSHPEGKIHLFRYPSLDACATDENKRGSVDADGIQPQFSAGAAVCNLCFELGPSPMEELSLKTARDRSASRSGLKTAVWLKSVLEHARTCSSYCFARVAADQRSDGSCYSWHGRA